MGNNNNNNNNNKKEKKKKVAISSVPISTVYKCTVHVHHFI